MRVNVADFDSLLSIFQTIRVIGNAMVPFSLSLFLQRNMLLFLEKKKKSNDVVFKCVSIWDSFEMGPVVESTLIRHFWLIDGPFCARTICVTGSREVNLFNLWTRANSGNFLWLYMWGGSRSAGGTSCPPLCGGCLLCGYNMLGQVYCLERGCAVVLLQLWAGTGYLWRTKTLTSWMRVGENCFHTQLGLGMTRNGPWSLLIVKWKDVCNGSFMSTHWSVNVLKCLVIKCCHTVYAGCTEPCKHSLWLRLLGILA